MRNGTLMSLAFGVVVGALLVTENPEMAQSIAKGKKKLQAKKSKLGGMFC